MSAGAIEQGRTPNGAFHLSFSSCGNSSHCSFATSSCTSLFGCGPRSLLVFSKRSYGHTVQQPTVESTTRIPTLVHILTGSIEAPSSLAQEKVRCSRNRDSEDTRIEWL